MVAVLEKVINKLFSEKLQYIYYSLIFLASLFVSCGTNKKREVQTNKASAFVKSDRFYVLKETFNQEDVPVNEYLSDILKPIRANFKRINSITTWTSVDTEGLWETTEGGEATYYYQNEQLEKIITRHYSETGQLLTEYYLKNEELSFVFEKQLTYNRPFYYDTIAMKENNDTEVFDFDKSEIIEDRSYFENGKLVHQINSQYCGAPFANDYLLEEQKRIRADFDKLIDLKK